MPTVLCVSHVAPWPAEGGNAMRLQKLLLWLRSQGWRCILVLTTPPYAAEQIEQIQAHVDQLEIASAHHPLLAIQSRRLKIQTLIRHGWPLVGRHSRPGASNKGMQKLADELCPDHVNQLVHRIVQGQSVDCLLAYYAFTIQAFAGLPRSIRLLCDTVELFSLSRLHADGSPMLPVLPFTAEEEQAMLEPCDVAIGIQPLEARYLRQLLPRHAVLTVGVDSNPPAQPGWPSQSRPVIGILGSNNAANQEGLAAFLLHSWPRIHQGCPEAELWLAGSLSMSLDQEGAPALPQGVKRLGWLADLEGFYRELRLVVNPVLRGTGLKVKTVEALAHSRPVVSYAVGLEGMAATETPGWLEVRDAREMADACLALLHDGPRCDQLAEAALRFARQEMSSDAVYGPLLRELNHRRR